MIYLGKDPVGMNTLAIDWDAVARGEEIKLFDNITLSSSIVEIANYAFLGFPIKNISGENVTTIGSNSFYQCLNLVSCNFPNLQVIKNSGLRNSKLNYLVAPKLYEIGQDAFYTINTLKCLDIGNKSIDAFIAGLYPFEQTASCITIFRYNFVLPAAANWFYNNCWLKNTTIPGTLYVWQNLIEGYQNHEIWGPLLASNNNQILPIEGSIYETQYGDGTPIE